MPQRFLFIYEHVQTVATTAVGQGDTGLTLECSRKPAAIARAILRRLLEELFTQILALVVVALLQNAVEYAGGVRRVAAADPRGTRWRGGGVGGGRRPHLAHNLFELSMPLRWSRFAGACPLVGLVALLNNAIEGRCDASSPLPAAADAAARRRFGAWNSILTSRIPGHPHEFDPALPHVHRAVSSSSPRPPPTSRTRAALASSRCHRARFLALLLVDLLIPDVEEGYVARLASQRKLLEAPRRAAAGGRRRRRRRRRAAGGRRRRRRRGPPPPPPPIKGGVSAVRPLAAAVVPAGGGGRRRRVARRRRSRPRSPRRRRQEGGRAGNPVKDLGVKRGKLVRHRVDAEPRARAPPARRAPTRCGCCR